MEQLYLVIFVIFMVVMMASFLVILILLGHALRELFRDLKQFRQEMHEELVLLIGQIAKMSTAQEHISKILNGMVRYTLPKDDGR